MTIKAKLLWLWREVPFPEPLRHVFLRILNPSFMVGAMALVQDEQGRVLLLYHTYRKQLPWGLPGGWLKRAESLEAGLAREVYEETGLRVSVDELLAADFFTGNQLDLLYRCSIVAGTYHPTEETSRHAWVRPDELPELLLNQRALLARAGVVRPSSPI